MTKKPTSYDFKNCKTRKSKNGKFTKDDVEAAVRKTGGIYIEMAKLLGRTRRSVKDYVDANPDMQVLRQDILEGRLDDAEASLFDLAIAEKDGASLRYLLSTLGKNRGYTTRTEVSGPEGGPIETTIDTSKLSDKALKDILAARKPKDK